MNSLNAELFAREQFRIAHLQVYNWGTFSGLHDIPISPQGFLFVGRSGAGKSTLLDAFSAVLVPPQWVDFNAAAREAEKTGRDRNLVSYVRGAWAEQNDGESGEVVTRYLRPATTWSALALTYFNGTGQRVVLVRMFWLRGNAHLPADVAKHYMVFERDFDLRELEWFSEANLEKRKLKQHFPDEFHADQFAAYSERFSQLLGIDSDRALRLLHKTQSAKNLGDLNTFLRDFMLDKPETFDVAERLVTEFGELSAAHQAVVTARDQVQLLSPARDEYQTREGLLLQNNELAELEAGIDGFRDRLRVDLLQQQIAIARIESEGVEGEVHRHRALWEGHREQLRALEDRHREMGGDRIEQWERDIKNNQDLCTERTRKRRQASDACQLLGWTLRDTPQGFAEQVGQAREEIERRDERAEQLRAQSDDLVIQRRDAESAFGAARKEIEALRAQSSNIPSRMLELRNEIAQAIAISPSALPFVGELLQVNADQRPWQGAIERVMRGFSLSLLVDDKHYLAVSNYVNATPLRGQRLVYYRTGKVNNRPARALSIDSLFLKLEIKHSEHSPWLSAELRQRFDYACVDSLRAFRAADRAVTIEGQVKHSSTRHEKDDRHSLSDPRNWVLGFDNSDKLALYQQEAQELAGLMADLERQSQRLRHQTEQLTTRAIHCQTLINTTWKDIDIASLMDAIDRLTGQIEDLRRGSRDLAELGLAMERASCQVEASRKLLQSFEVRLATLEKEEQSYQKQLREMPTTIALTPAQENGLKGRFATRPESQKLETLDRAATAISRNLKDESAALAMHMNACATRIANAFAEFKRRWPTEASDLDDTLNSATEFFIKLTRLEIDGLPAHEQRFFELLQSQSNQNLAALSTHLSDARKGILERMELVNESLGQVPFNQSQQQKTFLHIDVSDRQLTQVRDFKQHIREALGHSFSDDRVLAESRFEVLRQLVERLGSQDPEERRWREAVLDVRQHVEFIGREADQAGVEVEIYRSGAGKSGGQRQKLATTCLAAALRYQLGGNYHGFPMYAAVILDEAFDKADNEFTALAMNIFKNFGFQMIVATPLKSVMTLEPFIGGACFVDITDRRVSGVLMIEYDQATQRLQLSEQMRQEDDDETS